MTTDLINLPESIQKFVHELVVQTNPEQVILFGSRARGDHRPNSDFDLACKFKNKDASAWTRFLVFSEDEALTLFQVDVVDYDEVRDEYKKNIDREGQVIYERSRS